jgi:hypothetical protein
VWAHSKTLCWRPSRLTDHAWAYRPTDSETTGHRPIASESRCLGGIPWCRVRQHRRVGPSADESILHGTCTRYGSRRTNPTALPVLRVSTTEGTAVVTGGPKVAQREDVNGQFSVPSFIASPQQSSLLLFYLWMLRMTFGACRTLTLHSRSCHHPKHISQRTLKRLQILCLKNIPLRWYCFSLHAVESLVFLELSRKKRNYWRCGDITTDAPRSGPRVMGAWMLDSRAGVGLTATRLWFCARKTVECRRVRVVLNCTGRQRGRVTYWAAFVPVLGANKHLRSALQLLDLVPTEGTTNAEEVSPMTNDVFWDVTPCGSCKNRRFGGT